MNFVSVSFLALFAVAWALRLAAPSGSRGYVVGLLLLSWTFYAWHVPWYLGLIVASTMVDYLAARMLATTEAPLSRRAVLAASLAVNLGLLGFFKYGGFLARTVADLATAIGLEGWEASLPEVVLPIGISFYTFQSMSYTIDVYRGRVAAERSFLRVATYIAFFPQLVAGPIVRASDFLYQLDRQRRVRLRVLSEGSYLIVRGLFLKVVVADNLGRIVDELWETAAAEEGSPVVAAAVLVLFAGQLFGDFAGYTDIARGVAFHLGFRLPVNFRAPYIAVSFAEFWRRWHVSLSSWMRDYLYIPLGGSRRGAARGLVNLGVVMVLSGLWHGAAWTFVLWGLVHGIAAACERVVGLARGGRSTVAALLWAVVVQVTWVASMGLFRAESLGQAVGVLGNAASLLMPGSVSSELEEKTAYLLWMGAAFLAPLVAFHLRAWLAERLGWASSPLERAAYAGGMVAAILMLYTTGQDFIYFQF